MLDCYRAVTTLQRLQLPTDNSNLHADTCQMRRQRDSTHAHVLQPMYMIRKTRGYDGRAVL